MAAGGIPVHRDDARLLSLDLLASERDEPGTPDFDTNLVATLAEFLAECAQSLRTEAGRGGGRYSSEFCQARDVFLHAGLEALTSRRWRAGNDWVQLGLRPSGGQPPDAEFCRQVASLARQLLRDSTIGNFFFMHKPPGIRLRFQPVSGGSSAVLEELLHSTVARWREEGRIEAVERGVYEPESQLFGGPQAMSFVHALFTLDSLLWLDYRAHCAGESGAVDPAWLVSLAVLRTVFTGLDITGWEDIGVWACIRDQGGRRLAKASEPLLLFAEVARDIRNVWSRSDQIVDELDPITKAIVIDHERGLSKGAARWRTGYFCQPGAVRGPRMAAAFYVIFHWNRAALSPTEQALLAESLADRVFDNVRG